MTPAKISIGLCLAAAVFTAGYMANGHSTAARSTSAQNRVYFACPMHPQYKSDHAGDCPSCGMRLEPVSEAAVSETASSSPETVRISAAQQQLTGVRADVVQNTSNSKVLRVSGRIAPDDSRVYRLIAATDGWVRELGRNPAGAMVKSNEVLASYFVRDLVSAQQNYLYAYQTNAAAQQPNVVPQRNSAALNLRLALDALRGLGMTDGEIEDLQRKGQPSPDMHLYSPAAGLVLSRNLSPGQRFDKGSELYRIADLGHVWVMADIFEKDREFLTPGAAATVRYRAREFHARMSDLLPDFDPQSRTLKTRFELDNPGYVLRPGMFVEVEVQVNAPAGITVPADAVIDSGLRKIVYIEQQSGVFEPRQVQTGWRAGDRVEITHGLEPGERVVVAGNFLIDSESRMRSGSITTSSTKEIATAAKDAVCGMSVDPKSPAALKAEYRRTAYYFCSSQCKKTFESNPEKFLSVQRRASTGRGPA